MDLLRPAGAKPSPDANSAGGDGWRIGQRLAAVVLRGTAAGGGEAQLRIGRQTLLVRSQLPLVQGDHLAIEVTRLAPTITLRAVEPERAAADPHAAQAQAALRTLLPRQSGLPQLFAALTAVPARPRTVDTPDAIPLRQAIDKLLGNLLRSGQLDDASALRQALLNAGTLFDARAAAGDRAQGDLKGLLLQLLRSAAQAGPHSGPSSNPGADAPPPQRDGTLNPQPRVTPQAAQSSTAADTQAFQIRQLADGALARTALHQLSSVDGSRMGAFLLHGELPIRERNGVDVVHFRIRREARRTKRGGGAHPWSVSLALDLPGLGPLHARIGIHGRSVATRFWAEREGTRQAIERELPSLASALARCGLEAAALSCHAGTPPRDEPTPAASDSALLDTRA